MNLRRIVPMIVLVLAAASLAPAATPAHGAVNINTATVDQLQLLPRIGPALAQRIVDFRKANGEFKSVDELLAVKGVGERSLERLRPYVAVKGSTTLSQKVHLPRKASKKASGS